MRGICDGCHKERNDIRSCGRDSNGDPDAPDLCFFCRKKEERHPYRSPGPDSFYVIEWANGARDTADTYELAQELVARAGERATIRLVASP